MPKRSQDAMKANASRIVDQVFNEESKTKFAKDIWKMLLMILHLQSDLSRIAEKQFLQGREGLQDLEKMEAAVSMANRGKEMARMSPDQIELEVANELLDLKEAVPGRGM